MTQEKPFPLPEREGPLAPLWQAASRHEFRLPRCRSCKTFDWYPVAKCRQCQGNDIVWERLSGRGTLFSWAVVNRALHKPLTVIAPYISAIIVIEEDHKTRFVTRLVDCDAAQLRAGILVKVRYLDLGYPAIETGVTAPLFTCVTTNEQDHA